MAEEIRKCTICEKDAPITRMFSKYTCQACHNKSDYMKRQYKPYEICIHCLEHKPMTEMENAYVCEQCKNKFEYRKQTIRRMESERSNGIKKAESIEEFQAGAWAQGMSYAERQQQETIAKIRAGLL